MNLGTTTFWISTAASRLERREIEEEARKEGTLWEAAIDLFNDRFFVPFKLEAKKRPLSPWAMNRFSTSLTRLMMGLAQLLFRKKH